ncbi:hypothetical protein PPL_05075 [Heterostelium album PN500]|uniref:Uncharacterized protein n=1 Tax=Heterostelium pallidum (strain ATCC 26659 / Pp 5 / PN500) TaxID=670386 RepID=D3B9D1_HETP5|nr:hypothetical protein PPL_05075 [Heterostelium album PN500]EFA81843.1 hypothetical protein PPL_05075 [Heterostelium album PN500]|eukprot:XP_020433960.1 hypothetical protein PPL_05075 [Heterostelium album PN500]
MNSSKNKVLQKDINLMSLVELEKLLQSKNSLYSSVGANLPDKGEKILNNIKEINQLITKIKSGNTSSVVIEESNKTTTTNSTIEKEKEIEINNNAEIYGKPNSMNDDDRLIFQMKTLSMKSKSKDSMMKTNKSPPAPNKPIRQAKELTLEESIKLYDETQTMKSMEHYPEYSLDETNSSTSDQCDHDNDLHDIYDTSYDYKLHDEFGQFVDDEETAVPMEKYINN